MPVSVEELRPDLLAFDFSRLFVEGLGWGRYVSDPFVVTVDDRDYTIKPIAEKAGFAVYECMPGQGADIPQYPIRRKIESQIAKRNFEHLIVFVDPDRTVQKWQWVKREAGKPLACREQDFYAGQSGQPVLQRLQDVAFSLEDEAKGIGISDVTSRIYKAFDVEKVTKKFYDRFRKELTAFGNFIDGIIAEGDRDWYASLMLNRMMFVYFIQKQGFLDGDSDYLRNRLKKVQKQSGDGRFQQFYRIFLLRLFHEGLGLPEHQRAPDLEELLGKVPFLNGGLFDVHDLERDNPDIAIPDTAFERVFDFFDDYRWHLDERRHREDNEINPDVLGYIFEKYVNQKQMGAYYTKEDITGYISRNTIIPFLFDAARKKCPVAFGPDGGVWRLLREDPDRYIYPAVGHGITWNARETENPVRLDSPFILPDHIAPGVDDVSKRDGWNTPAPDDCGLPTETWREVVARRTRYCEIKTKLTAGEVGEINDLVTLNLDIEQFAKDVIAQSEGPELLRAFWHALYGTRDRSDNGIFVLDPTCGSGAFLFAALNVLEPLFVSCLEGMLGFLNDADRSERKRSPEHLRDFRRILEQVDAHPNESYFILKSIVLNNLYGVDIMEEAVEICKLRLFLKLVAQLNHHDEIEPLPDIDFNVRAGNTLVGFTSLEAVRQAMTALPDGQRRMLSVEDRKTLERINEDAEIANVAFNQFRWQQSLRGGEVTAADKDALRDRLRNLEYELDVLLAMEYGIDIKNGGVYDAWRASHQPFHWFVEFYGIMSKGGFDVVIGNPPYVEYNKVKDDYTIRDYATTSCGNLYAFVLERSKKLARRSASLSMIVPLSGHSTKRMQPLVKSFYQAFESCHLFNISADANPSVLFTGVKFRLAVFIVSNQPGGVFTTGYCRWYAEQRDWLFNLVNYTDIGDLQYSSAIPKVSGRTHLQVLDKMLSASGPIKNSLTGKKGETETVLYHSTPVNWIRAHKEPPYFHSERDGYKIPTGLNSLKPPVGSSGPVHCALASTAFFIWWLSLSDGYHLNRPEVLEFPLFQDAALVELSVELEKDMKSNTRRRVYHYRTSGRVEYDEFYLKESKRLIDEVDRILAPHFGFTDEELDFIINFDIKYRMGRQN